MNVMTKQISPRLDQPVTAALRMLAIDAVEHAKSGHPGAPMGPRRSCCRAVAPLPAPQSSEPGVARSRPLRALERPRLYAALRPAAPQRLRSADRASSSAFVSSIRKLPVIPKSVLRLALRPQPARSARALPMRSEWRSQRKRSPRSSTARGILLSITARSRSSATAA